MKPSEILRLTQLQEKKDSGEALTAMEESFYKTLKVKEIQYRKEQMKNGGNGGNDPGRGNPESTAPNPGADSSTSGEEGGSGRSGGNSGGTPDRRTGILAENDPRGTDRTSTNSGEFPDGNGNGSGNPDGSSNPRNHEGEGENGRSRRNRGRIERSRPDGGTAGGTADGAEENKQTRIHEEPSILIPAPEPVPVPAKSSRKKAGRKAPSPVVGSENLSNILMAGFAMIAGLSNRPHWAITDKEATSISDPLEKVLADMSPKQIEIIDKYSAPVMLGMAVAGVVVPRVMIDLETNKQKRGTKGTINNVKVETESSPNAVGGNASESGGSTPDVGGTRPDASTDFAHLFTERNSPI